MTFIRLVAGWVLAVAIPGVPVAYASHRMTTWRHYRVVDEGRLYRSGQLTPQVLDRVIHDQGIRTVVCLRALSRAGDTTPENAEEHWCAGRGVRYVRLDPAPWGTPASQANLEAFLRVTDDPAAGPVLVHCFAGLHRTGVYCAVYRMERQGWSNAEAVAEMYAVGYFQEDPTALDFLRTYVPDHRRPPLD
jgi:tyrosine-protein phosphatase SIW14